MIEEKLPPHDTEAEEAIIGSLLIDPEAVFKVATFLTPEDFFDETNRLIYQACLALHQRNEVLDQITVAHELLRQDKLEEVGGAAYLSHLISVTPTPFYVEHHAQMVSNMAVMRQLIVAAGRIAAIGYEAGPDVEDSLNKAEDIIFQIGRRQSSTNLVSIRNVLDKYFELPPEEKKTPQVKTGFRGLDVLLGGLHRSDLIVLAARPSMGKTSLALNIARNAAVEQDACVVLFSLEMSRDSVVYRLLSSEARVDSRDVCSGELTERERDRIVHATGVLSEARIYIDDTPQMRVIDIRSKARRFAREHHLDMVVIDYLQLMRGEGRSENRVQEITNITGALKALAKELDVPVLTVSQMSRAIEHRPWGSRKPQLSDLRESGSIEQDADVVFFIYNEAKAQDLTEGDWNARYDPEKEPYPKDQVDIIVRKHRNGPLGEVKLRFQPKFSRFDNLEAAAAGSEGLI
jgi:replicative DNA helicase